MKKAQDPFIPFNQLKMDNLLVEDKTSLDTLVVPSYKSNSKLLIFLKDSKYK